MRLLLRICDKAELSDDQLELLRELNYEAHRTALLCFVSLCKKYGHTEALLPATALCKLKEDDEEEEDEDEYEDNDSESGSDSDDNSEESGQPGVSIEFRRAICSGDIWRNITSYT